MTDLVHYRGCQYPADKLPKGADPAEVTPLDEWFAANRTPRRKAVLAPDAGGISAEQAAAEQAAAEQAAAEQAAAEQAAAEQAKATAKGSKNR